MIRFFVSSTFADMQKERDYLQRVIAPELEKKANEHYETVLFEDFRWGIDTSDLLEEEHNAKVLKICLDEVENCQPYLLIMIGGRYGSSVSTGELKEYRERYENYEFSEDGLVSLTELEIVLGTRQFTSLDKCVLCFREDALKICEISDEDLSVDDLKLKKLILSLKSGNPKHCITYANMEEFGEGLTQELRAIFDEEYEQPQYKSQVLKAIKDFEFKASKIHARNYGTSVYDYEIAEEIEDGEHEILALYGTSGCGKSYALNRAYYKYKDDSQHSAVMYFCDENRYARNTKAILITAIAFLENAMEKVCSVSYETPDSLSDLKTKFGELVEEYWNTYHKKLLIFVDSFEQLKSEHVNLICNWIPKANKDYFKVILTWGEEELPLFRKSNEVHFENNITRTEAEEQIAGYEAFRKKTIPEVIKTKLFEIVTKGNELTLALLLMRMDLMDETDFTVINQNEEQRNSYFGKIMENLSNSENMCADIIEKANSLLGIEGVNHALAYLALSRSGLREHDLKALLSRCGVEWSTFDFSYLRNSVSDMFTEGAEGEINFSHEQFRMSAKKQLKEQEIYAAHMKDYLLTLPVEDSIFRDNIFAMAKLCKNYCGVGKYLIWLAKRYEQIRFYKNIDSMDALGERDFVEAVQAIVYDTRTKSSLLKEILQEIDAADAEEKYLTCQYLSQVLDVTLTNQVNVSACRTCMQHLGDYCKHSSDERMEELWLSCELGAAYSHVFEGNFEKGKDCLKKCKAGCEDYYHRNPKSEKAFNVYFLWMARMLLANRHHAVDCMRRGNQKASVKANAYFLEAREMAKTQYQKTIEFLDYVDAKDTLWKLYNVLTAWRGSIAKEEPKQLGILLKATEEYTARVEAVVTEDSKVELLSLLDAKLLAINIQLEQSRQNHKQLLAEMRTCKKYADRIYLYFEESRAYRLLYNFYQVFYRVAILCLYYGIECQWDELYAAVEKSIDFLIDFEYMFSREVYEGEYKKLQLYFEQMPMRENRDLKRERELKQALEMVQKKLQKKIEQDKQNGGKR